MKIKNWKTPSALLVSLGILFSRIAGLVRERVFAHYLGNSLPAGAFRAALRIPNLLQNLFGEGVLSASFIPVYAKLLAEGKPEEAKRIASIVFSLLFLLTSILCLVGVVLSRPLIQLLAPGFSGEAKELTILLVQIMFPGTGLLVLSAWCLGVLNSHRKFFLSYVAPVFWNLSMIVFLLALGGRYYSSAAQQMELVKWVAWSTVLGSFFQLIFQIPPTLKLNQGFKPEIDFKTPALKTVLSNFFPALLSRGVVQLSAYIDQILSSFLGPQTVSALAYGQTLYLLPISLFGMAISSAELPELASTLGAFEEKTIAMRSRLSTGLKRIAFFIIPSSVAFLILGDVLCATLLQTGRFTAQDSQMVWWILIGSSFGILANSQSRLCVSVFWALHESKTPARLAFFRVLLSAILGVGIVFPLRAHTPWSSAFYAALLTGVTSLAGWVEYLLIRRALAQRIGYFSMEVRKTFIFLIISLFAALTVRLLSNLFSVGVPWVRGLILLGLYGGLYLSLGWLLKLKEALDCLAPFCRRFNR